MATMAELQEKLEKLTAELRSKEVYFPPKEKKIKPFNGIDGVLVSDFIEDVRTGMKLRRLQGENAVDYILAHLEGAARQEIKHRPDQEKKDADAVLKILQEAFGDRLSCGQLLRQLYSRTQKDSESVADYGYALLALSARLEEKAGTKDAEKAIKEQFQDGLRDPVLRREIKRVLKEKPSLTFLEVRDWAVEMEEGERCPPARQKRGGVYQVETKSEMGTMVECLTAAIRSQTDVLEKMRQQQDTFNSRLTQLEERRDGPTGQRPPFDIRNVRCYRCGIMGHFARRCQNPPAANMTLPPTPSTTSMTMPPAPHAQQFPQSGN